MWIFCGGLGYRCFISYDNDVGEMKDSRKFIYFNAKIISYY